MKSADLKNKTVEELRKLENEDRAKLQQLRFDLAGGKVKNVREIRKIRRNIARLLTQITQKQQ